MKISNEHKKLLLVDEIVNTIDLTNIEDLTLKQLLDLKFTKFKNDKLQKYIG